MTPRPPGRPPKGDDKRTIAVKISLSPAEAAALDELRGETSRAVWLRDQLLSLGSMMLDFMDNLEDLLAELDDEQLDQVIAMVETTKTPAFPRGNTEDDTP